MLTTCTPANPLFGTQTLSLSLLALVGLLGGAHCIGMCGPLVVTYADRMDGGRAGTLTLGEVRQHALFNVGRTASYTLLGGLFGLAGELLFVGLWDLTRLATDIHAVSGIAVGLAVGVTGIGYVTGGVGGDVRLPGLARLGAAVQSRVLPRVEDLVNGPRIVGLGAVHGLLPCPLLYPAYLYAFAQGSALGGATALAALGLGTVPAVFLTGTVFASLDVGGSRVLHRGLGVAFLALGYIPLQHGLAALGIALPAVPLPHFQPW
jgi:sulfite exporter TauE/SafE